MRSSGLLAIAICAALSWSAAAQHGPALPEPGPDLTGWLVDAQSGKPVANAVVRVTWVLRAEPAMIKAGGEGTRRVVKEIQPVAGGRFYVIDWRRLVDAKGYKLVPVQDPMVRVYAPGYRRLAIDNVTVGKDGRRVPANALDGVDWKWIGEGKVHALQPLASKPEAVARELETWKRDIESERRALPTQEKLLLAFDQLCATLASPPKGLCYSADSEIGRYLAQTKSERSKFLVVEDPSLRSRKFRITGEESTKPQGSAEAVPGPGFSSIPRPQ